MTVFVLFAVYLSLGNYNLNRITLRCLLKKDIFKKINRKVKSSWFLYAHHVVLEFLANSISRPQYTRIRNQDLLTQEKEDYSRTQITPPFGSKFYHFHSQSCRRVHSISVLTFWSEDEMWWCDHSNKTSFSTYGLTSFFSPLLLTTFKS